MLQLSDATRALALDICGLVTVAVMIAIVFSAVCHWKSSAKHFHATLMREMIWTLIPIVLFVILLLPLNFW